MGPVTQTSGRIPKSRSTLGFCYRLHNCSGLGSKFPEHPAGSDFRLHPSRGAPRTTYLGILQSGSKSPCFWARILMLRWPFGHLPISLNHAVLNVAVLGRTNLGSPSTQKCSIYYPKTKITSSEPQLEVLTSWFLNMIQIQNSTTWTSKEPKRMATYLKIETIGSIGSIILAMLEV